MSRDDGAQAQRQLRIQGRRERVHQLASRVMGKERVESLVAGRHRPDLAIEPFGYDPFGLETETALKALLALYPLYKKWFRVESEGIENIPAFGRALIVSNHSGVLPLDAVMIAVDIACRANPPRLTRAIIERFFAGVPFVSTFMQRVGQVIGTRRNFQWLLDHEELVAIFPEGAKGTGKLYKDRYKLIRFNVGFMELALLHRCPIIPTCVIGGEEQFPMLINVKPLARAIGFPYFPLTATFPWLGPLGFIPFPTKYKIYYGEPIHLYREYGPETLDHPRQIQQLVGEMQSRIQSMVQEALKRRKSVWRG